MLTFYNIFIFSCKTNADCTNKTCCMPNDQGVNKCFLKPHKIGQICNGQCACTGELDCRSLEVDQEEKINIIKKCSVKTLKPIVVDENDKEFVDDLVKRLREAKENIRG